MKYNNLVFSLSYLDFQLQINKKINNKIIRVMFQLGPSARPYIILCTTCILYLIEKIKNMKHVCFMLIPQPVSMVSLFSTPYYIPCVLLNSSKFPAPMIKGRLHLLFPQNKHLSSELFPLFSSNSCCFFFSLVWWVPH